MIENNSMPDDPLIAMVPVSMHVGADDDGNAVSAAMANLATNDPDPASRLKTLVGYEGQQERHPRPAPHPGTGAGCGRRSPRWRS